MLYSFLVIIAFTFHQTHGKVKIQIPAQDAEHATKIGFGLAHDLKCLYNGKISACVGPNSTNVSVVKEDSANDKTSITVEGNVRIEDAQGHQLTNW